MPRRRTPIHLCEVCSQPIYGDETVCPPCLRELDRILQGAIPALSDDEVEGFIPDGDTDRESWIGFEEGWQTSAVG
jgi:hypothetical protein